MINQVVNINREPDFTGPGGKAWRLNFSAELRANSPAGLDSYLVFAPGCHAFWQYWRVDAISLADFPGVPRAKKVSPEKTHEMLIVALNPEHPIDLDELEGAGTIHCLLPVDVAEQLEGITDEQMNEITESAVKAIVNGHISPDQDYRSAWKEALLRTNKHYIESVH